MLNLQRHRSHTVAMLLLAAAAWPAAAAPDEAAYGAASAYSHGDRSNWFRQDHLVGPSAGRPDHRPAAPLVAVAA